MGSFDVPLVPGYKWFEHGRARGKRGGIAILVRSNISVLTHHSAECAQLVTLLGPHGAKGSICNVYMPPVGTLGRRKVTEEAVRAQVEAILCKVLPTIPFLLVGDFNARTGSR